MADPRKSGSSKEDKEGLAPVERRSDRGKISNLLGGGEDQSIYTDGMEPPYPAQTGKDRGIRPLRFLEELNPESLGRIKEYIKQLTPLNLKEPFFISAEDYQHNEEQLTQSGFSSTATVIYEHEVDQNLKNDSNIYNQKLEEAKRNGWKHITILLPYNQGYTLWIKKPAVENVEEG